MRTSLAIAILLGAHAAHAQTSLAHSQKLGIEIFADDPNWCARAPTLRVTAPNAQAFAQPEVTELLQRVGTVVVAKLCPAAQEVFYTGTVAASLTPVWHGSATAARQWALLTPAAPTVNLDDKPAAPATVQTASAPPSTPPVPTQPAPSPPAPAAVSPLLGEWSGQTGCSANDPVSTTVSVFSVQGADAHAYIEITPSRSQQQSGALRFHADGSFDAVSGQFTLRPGEVVHGGSQGTAIGTIAGDAMTLQTSCYGVPPATLTRQPATPTLTQRILADQQRRTEWLAAFLSHPRPLGRLVGALPPGEPRQPSCEELLAWAAGSPPDLRVRLLDSDGYGMLRHYDDANSARVFGTAAYWWFTIEPDGRHRQTLDPSALVRRSCTPADQRDPRFVALSRVVNDNASLNALGDRRQTDELVDRTPIRLATTGGPAAEMYRDLAPLSQPATVAQGFAAATRWNAQSLNDLNEAQLVAEATRLRTLLADRGVATARAAIAAAPDTRDGIVAVNRAADQFAADFPNDAAPVRDAAEARRDVIGHAVAGSLATAPVPGTLDALTSRRTEMAGLQTLLGSSPAGAELTAALAQSDAVALPAALATETNALQDIPPTVGGVQALAARRDQVLHLAGTAVPDQVKAYLTAADARLASIGQAQMPDLRSRLAALPADWGSVRAAWDMAADTARPFGTAPVARDLRNIGNERVEAILASLADQAVATINAQPAANLPQIAQLAMAGDAAAQPFQDNLLGRTQASRIRQAAQIRANDRATAYFPTFQAAIAKAPVTRPAAQRLALIAVAMRRGMAQVPAFGRYADLARDAALRIQGDACNKAITSLGLSAADAKLPMMLGNRVGTLGTLACAFSNAGVVHGEFAPAAPDGDRTLKLFVPAGRADQVMEGAFQPGSMDPPIDAGRAELLDFAPAAHAEDGDILDVAVLVLRQVDVGVDRKALVAVEMGDQSQLRPLTVMRWRQLSSALSPGAPAGPDADPCPAYAADPDHLPPAAEARALLACPRKA